MCPYQSQNYFHPLCALWHTSLQHEVLTLLRNHDSLSSLKDLDFTCTLPLENPFPLFNLNTPEDIKRLSALAISADLSILTKK